MLAKWWEVGLKDWSKIMLELTELVMEVGKILLNVFIVLVV